MAYIFVVSSLSLSFTRHKYNRQQQATEKEKRKKKQFRVVLVVTGREEDERGRLRLTVVPCCLSICGANARLMSQQTGRGGEPCVIFMHAALVGSIWVQNLQGEAREIGKYEFDALLLFVFFFFVS